MGNIIEVLSTINSFGWFFGFLVACFALNKEQRAEVKHFLKRIWTYSTKAIPVLLALLTAAANIWEIYLFGSADSPPTRKDILALLLHCWNATSYFFFGMVLFAFWMKEIISKEYPVGSQT